MKLPTAPSRYAEEALSVLPPPFTERLSDIIPADRFEAALATFALPRAAAFRINTLLAGRDTVVTELARAGIPLHGVAWKEDAFWVPPDARDALLASAAFAEQRIYVQNLSSMIPPLVLAPEPGARVLDLCAAPGSKTLQLACAMAGEGELAAVEINKGRFFKLRALLEAQGAAAVRTFLQNGEKVWRYRPEHFDRVLLDAPCTTEGRFYTGAPQTFSYWSPAKIREMVRKQQRLLYSAVQCLRPGGVLVYSTCTFAPEENEGVIHRMLGRFGEAVALEPIELDLGAMPPPLASWQGKAFTADLAHARRILPTETMEGFFVCKLRKMESTVQERGG